MTFGYLVLKHQFYALYENRPLAEVLVTEPLAVAAPMPETLDNVAPTPLTADAPLDGELTELGQLLQELAQPNNPFMEFFPDFLHENYPNVVT